MRSKALAIASAIPLTFAATAALAEYPERPITMVIPFGAGGATDISARTIAKPLGDAVGQPLVMSNVTAPEVPRVRSRSRMPSPTATRCCLRASAHIRSVRP